jgi:hypothetical protein
MAIAESIQNAVELTTIKQMNKKNFFIMAVLNFAIKIRQES